MTKYMLLISVSDARNKLQRNIFWLHKCGNEVRIWKQFYVFSTGTQLHVLLNISAALVLAVTQHSVL
jgi:hypothetical protein